MGILWDFYGISMGILWEFYGISKGILWDFYGNSMGFLWDFYGNSMGFLWDFYVERYLSSGKPCLLEDDQDFKPCFAKGKLLNQTSNILSEGTAGSKGDKNDARLIITMTNVDRLGKRRFPGASGYSGTLPGMVSGFLPNSESDIAIHPAVPS